MMIRMDLDRAFGSIKFWQGHLSIFAFQFRQWVVVNGIKGLIYTVLFSSSGDVVPGFKVATDPDIDTVLSIFVSISLTPFKVVVFCVECRRSIGLAGLRTAAHTSLAALA